MIYPKEFENLLESFKNFPGVGEKSAERFVYAIYEMENEKVDLFSKNLLDFKKNIRNCSVCGYLTNKDVCSICDEDSNRDHSVICVVEDSKSVVMFEKSGKFNGVYHVLGGLISPIDEINPEDINISGLINRVNDNVSEIIIALSSSVEGEMTSLYIQKLLENKNIKLSRLSYGIPVGADIEYLDPLTIIRALDDRKFLS